MLFVHLALGTAHAKSCADVFTESGLMGGRNGYGHNIRYDFYKEYESMLFLSDGIKDTFGFRNEAKNLKGAFSIAERVAQKHPEAQVVQGDFNIKGDTTRGNLRQMHLDNTKSFPFAEKSFDLIIMRKGLCLCACGPCAGFNSKHNTSKAFFEEVVRALNTDNPRAMAVLHGQEKANPKVVDRWNRIAQELESQYPVEFTFVYAKPGWGFRDARISTKPEFIGKENTRAKTPEEGEFNSIVIRPINGSQTIPRI